MSPCNHHLKYKGKPLFVVVEKFIWLSDLLLPFAYLVHACKPIFALDSFSMKFAQMQLSDCGPALASFTTDTCTFAMR